MYYPIQLMGLQIKKKHYRLYYPGRPEKILASNSVGCLHIWVGSKTKTKKEKKKMSTFQEGALLVSGLCAKPTLPAEAAEECWPASGLGGLVSSPQS